MQVSCRFPIHRHSESWLEWTDGCNSNRGREGVQNARISDQEETGGSIVQGNSDNRNKPQPISQQTIRPAINYLETWSQIRDRHKRERLELVQSLAPHYTIDDAAYILNVLPATLRTYANNNEIWFLRTEWPSKTGGNNV